MYELRSLYENCGLVSDTDFLESEEIHFCFCEI